MDAYIAVRGSHNITEASDVPDDKMALAMEKLRPVQNHRVGKTSWCVLRWPNASMAQQAQMSTEAFEDFYFDVCLLDYAALVPAMKRLEELMTCDQGGPNHRPGHRPQVQHGRAIRHRLQRHPQHPRRRVLQRPGQR